MFPVELSNRWRHRLRGVMGKGEDIQTCSMSCHNSKSAGSCFCLWILDPSHSVCHTCWMSVRYGRRCCWSCSKIHSRWSSLDWQPTGSPLLFLALSCSFLPLPSLLLPPSFSPPLMSRTFLDLFGPHQGRTFQIFHFQLRLASDP